MTNKEDQRDSENKKGVLVFSYCVFSTSCVQYLSALAALDGTPLQRTVHLSFNPDEEIGGQDGLAAFVKTDLFKSLNVGFGMDEGLASSTEVG